MYFRRNILIMKKLLLLIPTMALLFSCNQEIPEAQYHESIKKSCLQQFKMLSDEDPTDEAVKSDICDCFADHYVAQADGVYTLKSIMGMAKDSEGMKAAFDGCEDDVLNPEEEVVPGTTGDEIVVDTSKLELQKAQ